MAEEIGTEERRLGEIAAELGANARELYERLDVSRELQDHPYRTLALAAAAGYVLGGGLFTPLTGNLLRVGMRLALLPLAQAAFLGDRGEPGSYGP